MTRILRHLGIFLLAFVVGTLYTVMVGMVSSHLRAALIAWPLEIIFFWILFGKFKLIRYVGFILVPPVLLLGFQLYWSARHPGLVADRYVAYDRSRYVPGTRVKAITYNQIDPDATGWNVAEIFIGTDGFRADPTTERGNPKTCRYVLIGDSMIYGSGLIYGDTLGPVLNELGIEACVFGVTGNSPADYLSTLKFVAPRIAPGAHIAFYIYAYNDFVGLSKYMTRRARGYAESFPSIAAWAHRFDLWRRSTIAYAWFHAPRARPVRKPWQYPAANGKQIKLTYATNPQNYNKPPPLNRNQRQALKFFFDGVSETVQGHSWRTAIVIHPDNSEIYANLAGGARVLQNLDPRRADGLEMCKLTSFFCVDISHFIYDKTMTEGRNPFFTDDRHFSRFGTRILAESFVELITRQGVTP